VNEGGECDYGISGNGKWRLVDRMWMEVMIMLREYVWSMEWMDYGSKSRALCISVEFKWEFRQGI